MTSLIIPNAVTAIESSAFRDCTGLTSITIPNSVTSIGSSAFSNCPSLPSVNIPNSLETIGDNAFCDCRKISSLTIPNKLTSVGKNAFQYCTGLSRLYISDLAAWCNIDFASSLSNPLFYAKKLYLNDTEITALAIPENLSKIKDYAFVCCSGLISLTIPSSVTYIGEDAFYNCSQLKYVNMPNSITAIGNSAFSRCIKLNTVDFDATNCTSMGSSSNPVFDGCSVLTNVNIGENVKTIPDYAFSGCTAVSSFTIPDKVNSIGTCAFENCTGLKSITSKSPKPANITLGSTVFKGVPTSTCVLFIPKGSLMDYVTAPQWVEFLNIEEKEISGIEDVVADKEFDGTYVVYDLNGILKLTTTDFAEIRNTLDKGIYIINGKKVLIK